ncbi:MAG: pyridoxal-phosphate dependent enzyme [Gemmatimonadetes bacterium]|nr:pyridoxal-phosphate dependent enzyme [Gemmatimonadota bacterium]
MNAQAIDRLTSWPRVRLAALPTRLTPAANLARQLAAASGAAGPEIVVKMDAETGFGLGGNKVRKLETFLAPPRLEGVTHLITTGGPQSNHCRVTAAAAAYLGLGCTLVVNGAVVGEPRGNALIHRLFGARIRTVGDRSERTPAMEEEARQVARAGGKALVVPLGASTGLGALGYAMAALELQLQLGQLPGRSRTWIFVSASSCGTLAGLLLGLSMLGREDVRLVGVSADVTAGDMRSDTLRLAGDGAKMLDFKGPLIEEALETDDSEVGDGYGIPTAASGEAIELFGKLEGIVLDPVYTGKAAAGMLAHIRSGAVDPRDRVVFIHTGGHPALLA